MNDLISRTEAIERIANDNVVGGIKRVNEYRQGVGGMNHYVEGVADAITTIEDIPSAEAVSREDYLQMTINYTKMTESFLDLKKYVDMLEHLSIEDRVRVMYDAVEDVHNIRIINEPSAEAVQGEWVRKYDDKVNCYWYECDQCGEYRPRNKFGHEYNANFCPNCGAKMHKGGDDE